MGLGGLGMWEMMLIFLIILLVFGAKRLPEIGSSLGKGIREFKGSLREIERELNHPTPPRPEVSSGDADEKASVEASSSDEEEQGEPRRLTTSN